MALFQIFAYTDIGNKSPAFAEYPHIRKVAVLRNAFDLLKEEIASIPLKSKPVTQYLMYLGYCEHFDDEVPIASGARSRVAFHTSRVCRVIKMTLSPPLSAAHVDDLELTGRDAFKSVLHCRQLRFKPLWDQRRPLPRPTTQLSLRMEVRHARKNRKVERSPQTRPRREKEAHIPARRRDFDACVR